MKVFRDEREASSCEGHELIIFLPRCSGPDFACFWKIWKWALLLQHSTISRCPHSALSPSEPDVQHRILHTAACLVRSSSLQLHGLWPTRLLCPWQEYWSGFLCPPPGDLPNPGIKPACPVAPALAGGFFTYWPICTEKLICKAEIEAQIWKSRLYGYQGRKEGGMNWKIGVDMYTLLCIK